MEVSKLSNKLHVKKDDTVLILSGDDKGKQGKVLAVSPKEGKVTQSRDRDKSQALGGWGSDGLSLNADPGPYSLRRLGQI